MIFLAILNSDRPLDDILGYIVEQACHSVDKIAWAMNGVLPLKAVATGGRQFPNHEGNIFDHIDKLRLGDNVLAIQGLNANNTSSDFLISAELTSTQGATGGTPGSPTPPGGASTSMMCTLMAFGTSLMRTTGYVS